MKYLIGAVLMCSVFMNVYYVKSFRKYQIVIVRDTKFWQQNEKYLTFYSLGEPKMETEPDTTVLRTASKEYRKWTVSLDSSQDFRITHSNRPDETN